MNSVEVYIPWNNTWLDLPALPYMEDGNHRMDETRIMYITDDSGGSFLYLLGGSSTDWNTEEGIFTGTVWTLSWDHGSQTYSWKSSLDPALGR